MTHRQIIPIDSIELEEGECIDDEDITCGGLQISRIYSNNSTDTTTNYEEVNMDIDSDSGLFFI